MPKSITLRLLPVALLPTTLLGACVTLTPHTVDAPVPAAWTADATPVQPEQWWRRPGDAELNKLVDLAVKDNHEVRIARARLREARADHVGARALLFPTLNAGGVAERGSEGLSYSYQTLSLTQGELDASFDLDLFGANKARAASAHAAVKASAAGLDDTIGAIRAEVASTYISLRQTQEDEASLAITASAAAVIATDQRDNWQKGLSSEADWRAADIDAHDAEAALSQLRQAEVQLVAALSVLTGDDRLSLQSELAITAPLPGLAADHDLDFPVVVIRRRPDVAEAEYQLASAASATRSAQASVFPDVSLQGFLGSQDSTVHPAFDVWNGAADLAVPLLNFGRLQSQIDAASARETQAYESYRLSVVSALSDVQTKLAAYREAGKRLDLVTMSNAGEARRFTQAHDQYDSGLTPRIAFQAAVIRQQSSHRALTDAHAEASLRAVALLRALGE